MSATVRVFSEVSRKFSEVLGSLGSAGSRNHVILGSDKDQIEIEIFDDSDSDR